MTALMMASRNGHVVVLDTLLKHGASVDFKKEVGIASLYSRVGGREFKEFATLGFFTTLPVNILYSSYMPQSFFLYIIFLIILSIIIELEFN